MFAIHFRMLNRFSGTTIYSIVGKDFTLEQFSFEFVSDGQGFCPWNPLGEMISPSPPQQDMYNFKVKMF